MKVKKTQKKTYKEKKKGISKHNHEIIGLVIFAAGILVLLGLYFQDTIGIFGEFIHNFLLGLMGLPAYLIPPLMIVYALFLIFKRIEREFNQRFLYILILLLLISAMIQTSLYNYKHYAGMSPLTSIYRFYTDGVSLSGGGILGGLISIPFLFMFQVVGTIIILTTIAIINIIFLTNISIASFIINAKQFFQNKFYKYIQSRKLENEEKSNTKIRNLLEAGDESKGIEKNNVIEFKTGNIVRVNLEAKDVKNRVDVEKEDVKSIEFIMKDAKKVAFSEAKSIEQAIEKKISVQGHSETVYKYPSFELLNQAAQEGIDVAGIRNAAMEGARKLEETLKSFGVEAKVINVSRGPAVTRYELQPSAGVKVSRIVNLSDDISLNLAASGVRIEAPIPGKAAVGIEVPNKEVTPVLLREVVETAEFTQYPSKLAFALGKDISGENIITDIAKMPHVLVAGATGSGKSVCINSLIVSLLYKASPDEVKLLMVDPKVVELGIYNGIPHLLIPVVTDAKKAAGALNWAVQEMVNRYKLFADKGVRDLKGYNAMLKENGENPLPHVVIIIDELADLMMVAPNDVEDAICRLAQMARAAGMHLVIATQRPSVDVITGVIKANIPSRIAFSVSSQVDSRTILDMAGAEKLLGKGDMLFYPVGEPKPIRVKGAFVSDKEVEKVVEFIKSQGNTEYDNTIIDEINSENESTEENPGDNDELLPQAIELVVDAGQASVSLIQRKFKVGYARAARIVDQMEARGIVGRFEGSKPRQVMLTKQQWQEMQFGNHLEA